MNMELCGSPETQTQTRILNSEEPGSLNYPSTRGTKSTRVIDVTDTNSIELRPWC